MQIAIIIGSTRPVRIGPQLAEQVVAGETDPYRAAGGNSQIDLFVPIYRQGDFAAAEQAEADAGVLDPAEVQDRREDGDAADFLQRQAADDPGLGQLI